MAKKQDSTLMEIKASMETILNVIPWQGKAGLREARYRVKGAWRWLGDYIKKHGQDDAAKEIQAIIEKARDSVQDYSRLLKAS